MPFHFPLETVLRLRRSLERQRELALQKANQQVALAQNGIERVDIALHDLANRQLQSLVYGLHGAELHFDDACRASLLCRRRELEKELSSALEHKAECLAHYRTALRERDILDTMRRQQLGTYHAEEVRYEQRQLDDLILLRRAFLRRG